MRHLGYETVPAGSLVPFPGNARRGVTEQIMRSLARFGQYRALLVREAGGGRPRTVVAGNHTREGITAILGMDAAQMRETFGPVLGDTCAQVWAGAPGTVRIELIECDSDDEASRINAADNRLAELGDYDPDLLAEQLTGFAGDFDGSGWRPEDLLALNSEFDPPDGGELPRLDQLVPRPCQRCGYDTANDPDRLAAV